MQKTAVFKKIDGDFWGQKGATAHYAEKVAKLIPASKSTLTIDAFEYDRHIVEFSWSNKYRKCRWRHITSSSNVALIVNDSVK